MRQIAEAVGTEARGDWSSARLVTAMTAGVIGATNFVTVDGQETETFPSTTAVENAAKLRDLMYEPGKGTWYTMTMVVTREGTADTDFDYDSEPTFVSIPVGDQAFVDDARIFPRDDDHTPDWLRGKLQGR
ncbi:hypothetical protein [Agrococcus baldri]|nr:hypothetical protein [Agrococcus baldri]